MDEELREDYRPSDEEEEEEEEEQYEEEEEEEVDSSEDDCTTEIIEEEMVPNWSENWEEEMYGQSVWGDVQLEQELS